MAAWGSGGSVCDISYVRGDLMLETLKESFRFYFYVGFCGGLSNQYLTRNRNDL